MNSIPRRKPPVKQLPGQRRIVQAKALDKSRYRIRRWTKLPVAGGFGISNAEHVAQVAEFADVAVIGSKIVELIENSTAETAPGVVARFIKGLQLPEAALAR